MGRWTKTKGSSGGGAALTYSGSDYAEPTYGSSGGGGGGAGGYADVGKTSIDLGDFAGSVGKSVGNVKDFFGSLAHAPFDFAGSAVKAVSPLTEHIGQFQVGGFELGQAVENVAGTAAVPYQAVGTVAGAAVGTGLDIISTPGRAVERTVAGQRVQGVAAARAKGLSVAETERITGLPEDLVLALDAGASIDKVADELVARGAGFSSNPVEQIAGQIVLDPVNFIAPLVGKAATGARAAGIALRTTETAANLGLSRRFAGTVYNVATQGLSRAGAATVERVIGPATDGIFHALGTKPYHGLLRGVAAVDPEAARIVEDAAARGVAQFPGAAIADDFADEARVAVARRGEATPQEALAFLPRDAELQQAIGLRAHVVKPSVMAQRVQEMAMRVVPDFHAVPYEQMAADTVRKLSLVTGFSPADALRALGGKVTTGAARWVHLVTYGKAGSELVRAKAAAAGAKNIDVERLTVLAPDTLTVERAENLLTAMTEGSTEAFDTALDRYSILGRKFGRSGDWGEVRAYLRNLLRNDMLPSAVKLPKMGRNALPDALGAWRAKWADVGYEVGFGPKDGWKGFVDDAGNVQISDPFVHFVDEATPLPHRNQLGRVMDSLGRGVTQSVIINTARSRFLGLSAGAGISDAEGERIFGSIMDATRPPTGPRRTPRSFDPSEYDALFRDALGDDAYRTFRAAHSPTVMVMEAFRGNLREVGIQQIVTGNAKVAGAKFGGNFIARITEEWWPKSKFTYNPHFQLQELIEAPFFRVIRGIGPQQTDDAASKILVEMAGQDGAIKYVWEAGNATYISTGNVAAAATKRGFLGRKLAKILPGEGGVMEVKERARVAQIFAEYPDGFKAAVQDFQPRLWTLMEDAYGTTDAAQVARSFIEERFAITADRTGNGIAAFIGPTANADEETVMQALREAFRAHSRQAYATQYFRHSRSFLERSINHPFLGLYPASYMWGKVAPELARFLLVRPFGLRAPLLGLNAYNRVQEALVEDAANGGALTGFIAAHPATLHLVNLLLPGLPAEIPVNIPAWARHMSRDLQSGRKIDSAWIRREVGNIGEYSTPLGSVGLYTDMAQEIARNVTSSGLLHDIGANVTRAAAEFDGMYPRR